MSKKTLESLIPKKLNDKTLQALSVMLEYEKFRQLYAEVRDYAIEMLKNKEWCNKYKFQYHNPFNPETQRREMHRIIIGYLRFKNII